MSEKVRTSATGSTLVSASGKIDERWRGPQVQSGSEKIVFNLGGVTSISSLGVRALESYLRSLQPARVMLIHVTAPIALQLNLTPTLRALVGVESARLPFACSKCGSERLHSVPWRSNAHVRFAPVCACGETMALDGMAEHYLPVREPSHPIRVVRR